MWSKLIERNLTNGIRLEDDLTRQIDEFFAGQKQVESYEIIDKHDWVVNVVGSIQIDQSDLNEGKLFFRIGSLIGNLFFHGKFFHPSVVPDEMDGEIIFVLDEEEQMKDRAKNGFGNEVNLKMGYLREKVRPIAKIQQDLEDVLTECISQTIPIDIEGILKKLREEWNNKDNYKLFFEAEKTISGNNVMCEFYITDNDNKYKLKLSAIEKALYILFILHKDGLMLIPSPKFKKMLKEIYSQIYPRVQDDKNGIMGGNFSESALNSCRNKIRNAIKEHISNARLVDLFAIEGLKVDVNKVVKATDELREQIRGLFTLTF